MSGTEYSAQAFYVYRICLIIAFYIEAIFVHSKIQVVYCEMKRL